MKSKIRGGFGPTSAAQTC